MTDRSLLDSQEQVFSSAAQICGGLNYSSSLALSNPATPPQRTLKEAWEHALQVLSGPDWQSFIQDSKNTIKDRWQEFGQSIVSGIIAFLRSELEGLIEMGRGLITWVTDLSSCVEDIGWGGMTHPDRIKSSEACRPFHSAADTMITISKTVRELGQLGVAGTLELVVEMLSLSFEVLNDVLTEGLQWLGDQADAVKAWLAQTARDAKALGELTGTILGTVLLELATAGVGRALKSVRIVSNLPLDSNTRGGLRNPMSLATSASRGEEENTDDRDRMGDAATELHGALWSPIIAIEAAGTPLSAAFIVPSQTSLAWPAVPTARATTAARRSTRKELDLLADVFQQILNKHHARFSKNLTARKLAILRKRVPEEEIQRFMKQRRAMARVIANDLKKTMGEIKSHAANVEWVRDYNRRVLAFHYGDAIVGEETTDYFDILARKDAILPRIFESNHIIEERLFHRLAGDQWRDEFQKLGWRSPNDMATVLMTADVHTGSVRQMLFRYGLAPEEIEDLAPAVPKNITRLQQDLIKFKEDLTHTPGAAVLVIDRDTPFSKVLDKYEEIYRTHTPDLWNKTMAAQFRQWRATLGLTQR